MSVKLDRETALRLGIEVPARASKYRNVRTVYAGVKYDSAAEAEWAKHLDFCQAAGHIDYWVGQPRFRLGCPENIYVPDFHVIGFDETWVDEVKGVWTPKFKRDVKLWRAYGPCPLRILTRGKVVETIVPNRRAKGA